VLPLLNKVNYYIFFNTFLMLMLVLQVQSGLRFTNMYGDLSSVCTHRIGRRETLVLFRLRSCRAADFICFLTEYNPLLFSQASSEIEEI